MSAQRASLIAFAVIAVWSSATLADEPELKLGQVRESNRWSSWHGEIGLDRGGRGGVLRKQGAKGSESGHVGADRQSAGALGGKHVSQCQ